VGTISFQLLYNASFIDMLNSSNLLSLKGSYKLFSADYISKNCYNSRYKNTILI
jgi:hypothetical protein